MISQYMNYKPWRLFLKKIKNFAFLFITALVIIGLDQWTKFLVRQNLDYSQIWIPEGMDWLYPYAYIVHWYNKGAAFGMFQDGNLIFTGLAIIVSILIIIYFPKLENEKWPLRLALAMQLGGAVGNLIDRLIVHHVTDFIAIGSFPVFNVADAAITVGVFVLLIGMYMSEKEKEKLAHPEKEIIEENE